MADNEPTGEPASPSTPSDQPAASPAPRGTDPIAVSALITGALGLGAIPLSLGIIGRHRAARSGRDDHGFSMVGIVLGAASMVAWFVVGSFALLSMGAHHAYRGDHGRPMIMHHQEFRPDPRGMHLDMDDEVQRPGMHEQMPGQSGHYRPEITPEDGRRGPARDLPVPAPDTTASPEATS